MSAMPRYALRARTFNAPSMKMLRVIANAAARRDIIMIMRARYRSFDEMSQREMW